MNVVCNYETSCGSNKQKIKSKMNQMDVPSSVGGSTTPEKRPEGAVCEVMELPG